MTFHNRFSRGPNVSIDFPSSRDSSVSVVHPEFKNECDINEIIRRFKTTGSLTDPSHPAVRRPMFGDFSSVPQPREVLDVFLEAQMAWDSLSDVQRSLFPGGPAEVLEALSDDKRKDDLISAGFLPNLSKTAEAVNPEPQKKAAEGKLAQPVE